MQTAQHYSEIFLLLGIVGLTIPFLHRFKISPVLGYLLCGIMIGTTTVSEWLETQRILPIRSLQDNNIIQSLSELGIIFLMFMIGLKLSLDGLWRMRHHIIGLGSAQIILTAAAIFLIAKSFGNSMEMSILLGSCFALSSTAVVMGLFEERDKTHTPVGKTSFSILLMQDLAVVPILTMVNIFGDSPGENVIFLIAKSMFIAMMAIVLIYLIGMRVLGPALKYVHSSNQPEWLMSFVLFIVIGTAMLTEAAGLSSALGAFLAGILLAETKYKDRIQEIISPVKGLLLGVFFLSVGIMMDPAIILKNPMWTFLSVIGIGFLKAGILFGLCQIFRLDTKVSAETSIMLGQSGEFVFVIMALALNKEIISVPDAQFFMMVTALSMMITPFFSKLAPHIAQKLS